jgi:uncharacterized tellurite resistance protein B-like protein
MMDALKKLFASKTPAEASMIDPHVAAAALMVEAALSDGVYADLESDVIAEILLESFRFDAAKADAVMAEGEQLAEEAVGAHQFTKHVKSLPLTERRAVIEGLYRVILADGEKCAIEESYVRHVASLLHVDDVSRALARQSAEARMA